MSESQASEMEKDKAAWDAALNYARPSAGERTSHAQTFFEGVLWQRKQSSIEKSPSVLVAENEKLRNALDFYAQPENWNGYKSKPIECIDSMDLEYIDPCVGSVGGKLARRTLREVSLTAEKINS